MMQRIEKEIEHWTLSTVIEIFLIIYSLVNLNSPQIFLSSGALPYTKTYNESFLNVVDCLKVPGQFKHYVELLTNNYAGV